MILPVLRLVSVYNDPQHRRLVFFWSFARKRGGQIQRLFNSSFYSCHIFFVNLSALVNRCLLGLTVIWEQGEKVGSEQCFREGDV